MGKPSFKSSKSSRIRKKSRKIRLTKTLKNKDEEVADLQIQMQEFKKLVFDSGKNILNEIKKTTRENDNLAKWLNLYDRQLKEREKEIYDLNVRLYFSQQQQPQPQQPQPQHQPHHLLKPQPQSPVFRSLDDYFAATSTATTTAASSATTTATSSATTSSATTSSATTTATSSATTTATTATLTTTSTFKNLVD
jgi:hypothetical protein